MAAEIPTEIPRYLTVGDTWTWEISLSDYAASDGWALSYALVSTSAQILITSSASSDDHLVEVAASTTATYTADDYRWQAYVISGSERYIVDRGDVTLRPNLAVASSGLDTRSVAEKTLDAIETYLTTGSIESSQYMIDGVQMQYVDLTDLLKMRDKLKAEVAGEIAKEKAQQAGLDPSTYRVRMGYY